MLYYVLCYTECFTSTLLAVLSDCTQPVDVFQFKFSSELSSVSAGREERLY